MEHSIRIVSHIDHAPNLFDCILNKALQTGPFNIFFHTKNLFEIPAVRRGVVHFTVFSHGHPETLIHITLKKKLNVRKKNSKNRKRRNQFQFSASA